MFINFIKTFWMQGLYIKIQLHCEDSSSIMKIPAPLWRFQLHYEDSISIMKIPAPYENSTSIMKILAPL